MEFIMKKRDEFAAYAVILMLREYASCACRRHLIIKEAIRGA